MVTVFNNKHLGWIGTTSLNHYELIVDDVANLPNDAYYFGPEHKMAQGSIAWIIASAEFYMFDSNGDWIPQANSGGGTGDYTDLSNKPQINGVTLAGDKSSSDLHLQAIIDAAHKLSADNVDDTNATNKFATAAQLSQIETNKNNISLLQQTIGDINSVLEEVL